MSDIKEAFANTLADSVSLQMNACERYGMTWGCDEDCPVLNNGGCEHWKTVDEYWDWKDEDTNER